jgi:hypothetical protein
MDPAAPVGQQQQQQLMFSAALLWPRVQAHTGGGGGYPVRVPAMKIMRWLLVNSPGCASRILHEIIPLFGD